MDRNLKKAAIFGALLCVPVTGFLYGLFACTSCGSGISGILFRIILGIVHVFSTIIGLGKPWNSAAGTSGTNLRPFILLTAVLITIIVFLFLDAARRKKEKKARDNGEFF